MSDVTVDVYWLPHCTTCQKAVQHLRVRGVAIGAFRDLKAQPLERPEVEDLARKVGGAEKLFSKRAMKYRQMGLHEQTLSEDDLLRLMAEEYTFITRPVIVRDDRATAGFSAKRVDELVGGAG
jgi:arsenate reductase